MALAQRALSGRSYSAASTSRRSHACRVSRSTRVAVLAKTSLNVEQLKGAKQALIEFLPSKNCQPIIVRLAWHDSGTHDKSIEAWPKRGGANGSIRFAPEITHAANTGLKSALDLLLPIHDKFPEVSWADLFQMASATAVEVAGGPKIPMRYGRRDVEAAEDCAKEGNLPAAGHPFPDGSGSPAEHIRRIFTRMGFNDQEIVALSGGHTLGRSTPERSGWGTETSKYTKDGPGRPGGQAWTPDWLVFNNRYFTEVKSQQDKELLVLPTDAAVFEDEKFRPHAERYAADQDNFFQEYALAHAKLSELGVEWVEGAPVTID